jgi:hypothetical protein
VPDLLRRGGKTSIREPDLHQTLNVAHRLASVLQQNDGPFESVPPLGEPQFVDNVLSGVVGTILVFVFGGKHKEGETASVEHLREALPEGKPRSGLTIELLVLKAEAVAEEILEIAPSSGAAVPNKDASAVGT